jgi:hypothetical protein
MVSSRIVDRTRFTLRNTILLTLPLVFVIGWFVAVYFFQYAMTRTFFSDAANMFIVQQTMLGSIDLVQKILDPSSVCLEALLDD